MKEGKNLKPSDFVHLHTHTHYSLLDGLSKVPELVELAKETGMEAMAITDHGTMSGAIEFYKEAKEKKIKPIIGIEAYVAPRKHTDKQVDKDKNYFHLTMLAMNRDGYQNLMQLATIANLEGFYYKPRVDRQLIEKYNPGIIVLSGCMGGELSDALRQDQYEKALEIASWYKNIFQDRYYIELQDHGHPDNPKPWAEQTRVNKLLLRLASELDIKAVVTCDAHYLRKADQQAHEILLCVQTGAFLSDTNRMSLADFELNVVDPKDIIERWGKTNPELILNTKEIANRCDLSIELGKILIPKFEVPKGKTEKSYLHELVWQGLAWRYGGKSSNEAVKLNKTQAQKLLPQAVIERANYELEIIDRMEFNGYFLIVADFINWGKNQGIVFGPGRGSAASSIVSYATKITEIDPIEYDLLFERFLNPDRISMPDIDIDIQDDRRDEVIEYCIEKYGAERVANIVTFGTMAARNSVRDVARVLEIPYSDADRLAKIIPPPVQGRHTPLSKLIKDNAEVSTEYQQNPRSKEIIDLAMGVEGTIRSHGVHAAGVVIAPDDIVKFVPLERAQKGVVATQYSMWPIEDIGLLKIDFLGLSNLTIIKNTLRIIKKVEGLDIDINQIPLDDPKTFELFQRGDTTGVFQLESAGMRRFLKKLKPTMFEDIIAMVALYRPGPMQWIEDFISRKHGLKAIEYLHPAMEPALNNTYGVIVYQEQVMQISKEMCGFSGGQADTLRKAIGKKIPSVMAKLKNDFIEGGIRVSGADRQLMETFWSQLEEFAAYCFNKVHSACYGLIAYQTAYLKANYPSAFMAALMTSNYDDTDKLAIDIAECKKMGLQVTPPDINQSFHEFAVVPNTNQIRFGLDAIKNVGHGAVEDILKSRQKMGGRFESLEDFLRHTPNTAVNRKTIESLIRAGAFDGFGNRGQLLDSIDELMAFAGRAHKQAVSGQVDLFGNAGDNSLTVSKLNLADSSDYDQADFLQWERELMGLYLSQHPLDGAAVWLEENCWPAGQLQADMAGTNLSLGGSIGSIREITTKSGSKMAFVQIVDLSGEAEAVVFPKVFEQNPELWQRDKLVKLSGKVDNKGRDGSPKLLVESVVAIDAKEFKDYQPKGRKYQPRRGSTEQQSVSPMPSFSPPQRLYIRMEKTDAELLAELKKQLDVNGGGTEVVLVTGAPNARQAIKLPQKFNPSEQSMRQLASAFGARNLILK